MTSTQASPSQVLQCMEIWGGNHTVEKNVSTPGLDIWVYSQPYEQSTHGGDVYYTSLCGGGVITRFLLADISGHGETVGEIGKSLRNMVRKNINRKSQTRLVQSLNREFSELAKMNRFATAIVATYLTTKDKLIVSNAGHPRPFYFRSATHNWSILDDTKVDSASGLANLPLGVIDETAYTQFEIPLDKGDLILFYTDAITESENINGEALGEIGFLELVRNISFSDPASIPSQLIARFESFRGQRPAKDDLTFILLHHNAGNPPRLSIREKLNVYAKVFGLKSV